jgi:CBS-domain-containing membrane protein
MEGWLSAEEGERVVATGRGLNMDAEAVRRRHGVWGELLLALPPTVIVLGAVLTIELLRHQRILFASLASSAFLIYRDPGHRMNSLRVVVSAHVVAVAWGIGAESLFQPGYLAAAVSMVGTIIALIVFDIVHPPAISTTLGFAFVAKQDQLVGLFLLALIMVAALVLMQRASEWTLHRLDR